MLNNQNFQNMVNLYIIHQMSSFFFVYLSLFKDVTSYGLQIFFVVTNETQGIFLAY